MHDLVALFTMVEAGGHGYTYMNSHESRTDLRPYGKRMIKRAEPGADEDHGETEEATSE